MNGDQSDSFTVEADYLRSTRRMHVFQEEKRDEWEGQAIPALYLLHDVIDILGNPTRIRVTIEPVHEEFSPTQGDS